MSDQIVISGAAGFIGKQTVAYGRLSGLKIRALVRKKFQAPTIWQSDPKIEIFARDLTEDEDLTSVFAGASAVIHTAASMSGNHDQDTVLASKNITDSIVRSGVQHVVLVSSISVYNVAALKDHDTLAEDCAVCEHGRDAYSSAKLQQEFMFKEASKQHGFTLTIIRPGAVFGPKRAFNSHIGAAIGPLIAMIDSGGRVPICHVNLLAQCLMHAAQSPNGVEKINVVDDALPNRDEFIAAFRDTGWPKLALRLPLGFARFLAQITPDLTTLPSLFNRSVLEARHKPLQYSNALMHNRLGPVTMMPFEAAMRQAIEIEQGLIK